jgi:hypothetical protein
MKWAGLIPVVLSLALSPRAFGTVRFSSEFSGSDEIGARVDLAIQTNDSQHPDFLSQVNPFGQFLYQIYQTDLGDLLVQLRLHEMRIYQQVAEFNFLIRLSELDAHCAELGLGCDSDSLPVVSELESWDFEKMLSQLGVQIVHSLPKIEGSGSGAQLSDGRNQESGDSKGGDQNRGPKGSQGESEKQLFVRAFDRDLTPLEAVRTEMVSLESSPRGVRGWQESIKDGLSLDSDRGRAAETYWPTLSWVDPLDVGPAPIPLMSSNTIRILESKFGGKLDGGIIFGKIASDWVIKFGGDGSKHPIFLNERFEVMSSEANHIPRYFVIAGVTGGAGLIQMISTQYPWSGSVRFPILEGKATFLDLSRPVMKRVSGKVLDRELMTRSSATLGPTEPSIVRLAGQTSPWTKTDQNNFFKMDEVLTVSHYPLFLDVERAGRTSLRYRVLPEKLSSIVLYRMKEREIDSWRAQLSLIHQDQGGGGLELSRDSSLVVGYLRNPISRNSDLDLLPYLRPLPSRSSRDSVAYVRSPGGLLERDIYLNVHDSRILGTQLANSGFLLGIQDEDGKPLYSEWGYTSPGVVSVVGPD